MANIELVIKIPEDTFKRYQESVDCEERAIIVHGIPLPKGHGRISDMDEAIKCIEDIEGEDAIWAINLIEWACAKRTIIEADKEK